MSENPVVSVVMPIYNAEKYLRQAMDSVLAQTLESLQVICVNDGSTDHSLDMLKEYAERDSRITIVNRPNGGYGRAMNIGIDAAVGDYIGILEPDDYLKPTMYEKLYTTALENNLDFIRSDYYRLTTNANGEEKLQRERLCNKEDYYGSILNPQDNLDLFNIRMENWTGIYKRSWLNEHNIRFNESPGASFQDNSFWFQTYCWATRIAVYDEAFYCYRVDNSASSINQPNKVFTMLDEYKWIENWLRSQPQLAERFLGIFLYKKTHNCEFAFSRLAEEYQLPFLERYASEYRKCIAANELDESFFWPDELNRLKSIVADPIAYLDAYRRGSDPTSQLEEARRQGKLTLFNYYRRSEGLGAAFKHALGYLSGNKARTN